MCAGRRKTPSTCSAGKVVDRHWYNKNKHIFPASNWAVYDADKAIQGADHKPPACGK